MSTPMRPRAGQPRGSWGDDFDNLFTGFFRPVAWAGEEAAEGLTPRIDVSERHDDFLVRAEMPGVHKDDISITVESGLLTLAGEAKASVTPEERVLRRERRYGRYVRSLRLGKEIDDSKVKASYSDGVLEVILPKAEEVKPKKIMVDVK